MACSSVLERNGRRDTSSRSRCRWCVPMKTIFGKVNYSIDTCLSVHILYTYISYV